MNVKKRWSVVVAAVTMAFIAGCGGDGDEHPQEPVAGKVTESAGNAAGKADKIATLEKDVARLNGEVQQLRRRIEIDAKMRSRPGMPPYPYQPGGRRPEDVRGGGFRRHPVPPRDPDSTRDNPADRQDPATMTPEQRRAWHEERRKMREERRQKMLEERNREKKISSSGKQTTTNTKEESK